MIDIKARIKAARVRLGIQEETFTEADVRLAAAAKLKEQHPDSSGVVREGSGAAIAKIKSDRAFLLRYATPDEEVQNVCPHCGGTGYVSD
ncbi:MAG: hypothetical protein MJH10_14480 [Epibacterium sp.]|nr:hypothetical protein [Epibacterium sp.]NQX74734.1 hypothetical protein [Epibacterium sp.]